MPCARIMPCVLLLAGLCPPTAAAPAVPVAPVAIRPPRSTLNLETTIQRPLRYRPDGTDFVIENGPEFFNRPLYSNTAFRVDGGDKPEFSLFLPGRGGNLRLGVRTAAGAFWLSDAAGIVTRYRPGSLLYEVKDPRLGGAVLRVAALVLEQYPGFIVRTELSGGPAAEIIWAYGGANGDRGSRDGDIGCERVPVSRFFQLHPEYCKGNVFTIGGDGFTLASPAGEVQGVASAGTRFAAADVALWDSPAALLASGGTQAPGQVLTGEAALSPGGAPFLLVLRRVQRPGEKVKVLKIYQEVEAGERTEQFAAAAAPPPDPTASSLAQLFDSAEAHRRVIAGAISVDTPDPFVNAAAAAICVEADGVWDEPSGTVQHGGAAWRVQLLGWRGPYANDEVGWHDRALRHFSFWAGRQNTEPVPAAIAPPDAATNLARNEAALHSNGDISDSHYDMNLVYIDEVFRNLEWTGDLAFARRMWPVIERHLAWERASSAGRSVPDGLPLYEAYCCIWASDDVGTRAAGRPIPRPTTTTRTGWLPGSRGSSGWIRPLRPGGRPDSEGDARELWLADQRLVRRMEGPARPPGGASEPGAVDLLPHGGLRSGDAPGGVADDPVHRHPDRPHPDKGAGRAGGWLVRPADDRLDALHLVDEQCRHGRGRAHGPGLLAGGAPGRGLPDLQGGRSHQHVPRALPGQRGHDDDLRHGARREPARLRRRGRHDGAGACRGAVWHRARRIRRRAPGPPGAFQGTGTTRTCSMPTSRSISAVPARPNLSSIEPSSRGRWRSAWSSPLFRDGCPRPGQRPARGLAAVADAVGSPGSRSTHPAAPLFRVRVAWKGDAPAGPGPRPSRRPGPRISGVLDPPGSCRSPIPRGPCGASQRGAWFKPSRRGGIRRPDRFRPCVPGPDALVVARRLRESVPPWKSFPNRGQDAAGLRFRLRNNTDEPLATDASVSSGGRSTTVRIDIPAGGNLRRNRRTGRRAASRVQPGDRRPRPGRISLADITDWKLPSARPPGSNPFRPPRPPQRPGDPDIQATNTWTPLAVLLPLDAEAGHRHLVPVHADGRHRRRRAEGRGGTGRTFALPDGRSPSRPRVPARPEHRSSRRSGGTIRSSRPLPLDGSAGHVYLLMAGSTNSMQSRFDNGEVIVTYADGTTARLALENPDNWWPDRRGLLARRLRVQAAGPDTPAD